LTFPVTFFPFFLTENQLDIFLHLNLLVEHLLTNMTSLIWHYWTLQKNKKTRLIQIYSTSFVFHILLCCFFSWLVNLRKLIFV